ncbi:hypothetical protein Bca52824_066569 [Brassica carinata]|uniref:Uncharacterized protein n=1 Tax=Brassica carinata TaxID=52824 RepID=A0A8X7QKD6_BRACI|nr:hypothetical protein Bca52824_066569 [Brassica carinata]
MCEQNSTLEPKHVDYRSRNIDLLFDIHTIDPKNQPRFSDRVDWRKRDQKCRSRTDSGSNRRRSWREDGAIRATVFPGTKAGKIDAVRVTVSRKQKLATAV